MRYRIDTIARALGARFEGNGALEFTHAAEPAHAGPKALAIASDPKYAAGLAQGAARAALLWEGADWQALGLEAAIFAPRPRYALAGLTTAMDPGPVIAPGVHPSAVIDPGATVGPGAAIGPFVWIGPGARVGARARIAAHASIAEGARIGDDALIHAGVRIGARVRIGDRFIAQPGAVIGADGFSFVTPEKSAVEAVRETLGDRGETAGQSWTRIHSLGSITLGDDVEIGANSTVDRGTIRDTEIGSGTRIDNLVQVGHNAIIGRDCLICGQAGVAGSARIGDRVVLGGRTAVSDHITVGDDVVTGGGTGVLSDVPAGRVMFGTPATKMETQIEIYKALRRLPRLVNQVAALRKSVTNRSDKGGDQDA